MADGRHDDHPQDDADAPTASSVQLDLARAYLNAAIRVASGQDSTYGMMGWSVGGDLVDAKKLDIALISAYAQLSMACTNGVDHGVIADECVEDARRLAQRSPRAASRWPRRQRRARIDPARRV